MPGDAVVIIGAGIIGLSLGLKLAQEKFAVIVVDRGQAGREASWAAAGMLSPAAEHGEHPALRALARASADLYPEWLASLGADVGHRREGTVVLASSDAEAVALEPLGGERLMPAQALRLEPALSERIVAGVYLEGDQQVDNRRLLEVLLAAARRARVRLLTGTEVRELVLGAGRAVGVRTIAPAVAALPFANAWAGLRPDTPDHLPILGATDIENFFVASGHFRNGILLAPLTAKLLTQVILGRCPSLPLGPFNPLRFAIK